MSWTRREVLERLGIGSAFALLWTLGCGTAGRHAPLAPRARSGEVRVWLHDAVARLAGTFPAVHALAVSRRRTSAAIDVLGTGIGRARRDGVVLTVRDRDGLWREQVTADLSAAGLLAAVRALGATAAPARIDFPAPPPPPTELPPVAEYALRDRVAMLMRDDRITSSRIVYAAGLIDVDDVTLWSLSPTHHREQTVRRVRQRATRAAWNGTRPIVSEVERGWAGGLADQELDDAALFAASKAALTLMTPGGFAEGAYDVVLEPAVTASLIEAAVRGLLTTTAAARPEVLRRAAIGTMLGAPALSLVDDPTVAGAYGGFAFDDEGEAARAIPLIEAGRVVGRLADRSAVAAKRAAMAGRGRRAGHLGELTPSPSHLQLAPGAVPGPQLHDGGWLLEGVVHAVFDPSSDHLVVRVARARELRGGNLTGRVFADVELVGDLATLLAAITGIARERATTVIREERAGEPCWRSISAPAVRTRGLVRAGRRPA